MTLELRALDADDEVHARAAHAELAVDGFAFLPFFDPAERWAEYLARIAPLSRGVGAPAGVVPWTDLYGVIDGVVVGRVSVRHRLTGSLARVGGHIGYGVRPAFRRRGHGTALLRAGMVVAHDVGIDPALLTCDDDNAGSAAVIERCGGVLQDVLVGEGRPKRRYWLATAGLLLLLLGGCTAGRGSAPDLGAPTRNLELAPGESATVVVSTHCGYAWLEVTVNDSLWRTTELRTDDAGNASEPAWPQAVQAAELELRLVDEGALDVTAVGSEVTHTYRPATGTSGCE